jgi:cytoskeletal protein RodZ
MIEGKNWKKKKKISAFMLFAMIILHGIPGSFDVLVIQEYYASYYMYRDLKNLVERKATQCGPLNRFSMYIFFVTTRIMHAM